MIHQITELDKNKLEFKDYTIINKINEIINHINNEEFDRKSGEIFMTAEKAQLMFDREKKIEENFKLNKIRRRISLPSCTLQEIRNILNE